MKSKGERRGSNPRPPGPQPGALPTELRPPKNLGVYPAGSRSSRSQTRVLDAPPHLGVGDAFLGANQRVPQGKTLGHQNIYDRTPCAFHRAFLAPPYRAPGSHPRPVRDGCQRAASASEQPACLGGGARPIRLGWAPFLWRRQRPRRGSLLPRPVDFRPTIAYAPSGRRPAPFARQHGQRHPRVHPTAA